MRPLSCGLVLLGTALGCGPAPLETMRVDQVLRELSADPSAWSVVAARAERPPAVEVLSPAIGPRADGADMPALILAPPTELCIEIRPDEIPCVLRGQVGIDATVPRQLPPDRPSASVVFEIELEGTLLAREVLRVERERPGENRWVELGGEQGLPLDRPGRLTLRTRALDDREQPFDPPLAASAGFSALRLERSLQRPRTRSSPDEPNIVLVVMDTQRADRLSAYGYERPTSPNLEALARRGVLHERAFSTASWTWPSTASILTGLLPREHGVLGEGSSFLAEETATLAERLQEHGFSTAAWSGNPIVSPRRNFDQGFESFTVGRDMFRKTGEFFPEVRAWLEQRAGTRFFLYLHLADPHGPLRPLPAGADRLAADVPLDAWQRVESCRKALGKGQAAVMEGTPLLEEQVSAEERRWAESLYDACVWSGDHWLGELLAALEELGLEDETLVAFTADHGEELFERGFLGHGQSLHEELVRVPLVLAGPGVPHGVRSRELISNRRLAPGLAQLAGVESPRGPAAARALLGQDSSVDAVFYSTVKGWWRGRNHAQLVGLREPGWSLILAPRTRSEIEAGRPPDQQLYDLGSDPLERRDVSRLEPERTTQMRERLLERMNELESRRQGEALPAGAATLRLLQQLGYGGQVVEEQ